MRMTRDEWTQRVKTIDDEARKKAMVKRVAQAIKRPEPAYGTTIDMQGKSVGELYNEMMSQTRRSK